MEKETTRRKETAKTCFQVILTKLSMKVAIEISTMRVMELCRFKQNSVGSSVMLFTHANHFYSYPGFGNTWKNGKECEYHGIETQCAVCGKRPDRNFAGIGTSYIRNDYNRFTILCNEHAKNHPIYCEIEFVKKQELQLTLF